MDRIVLPPRFYDRVDTSGKCWVWTGTATKSGYGQMFYEGRQEYAHRLSYRAHFGPIPDGLTIDHLCRTKLCVRPFHLEAVTLGENVLRGESLAARRARQTNCKQGHEFTEANTYRRGTRRECKKCRNRLSNESHRRSRASIMAMSA